MFQSYLTEIEKNHLEIVKLCAEDHRTDEETLSLFSLLRKNDELYKGLKLELASESQKDIKPERMARYKELEREHQKCSKVAQGTKTSWNNDLNKDDPANRQFERIRRHEENMENMNQAKRNIHQTIYVATDVKGQLDKDFEAFARQNESIKLLNEELVLSGDLLVKIAIRDKHSRYMFYAALFVPAILIISALFLRIVHSASGN